MKFLNRKFKIIDFLNKLILFIYLKRIYCSRKKRTEKIEENHSLKQSDTPTLLVTSQIISSSLMTIENIDKNKYKKYSNKIFNNLNGCLNNNKTNEEITRSIIMRDNNRYESLRNIPINMDALIRNNNKKVVEPRCISSLWRNYIK